jgi:bifunctional DNase/RNase
VRAALLILLIACGSAPLPPPPPPAPPPAPAEPSESSGIPTGYVDAHVLEVVPLGDDGGAVLLIDETSGLVLPIFIGGTEATSIALRKRGTKPPRPLTHDLLDAMVKKLGGEIVKVQVDELRDNTFFGSVFLRVGKRIVKIDARPSDALALAIGNKLPIYVAKKVLEQAGVPADEIKNKLGPPAQPSSDA